MFLAAVAGAALLFSGCSTVQTGSQFNGQRISTSTSDVAHVSAFASGFYFLWIPLITGSAENPGSITFGEDSCKTLPLTQAITKKSKELNATKTIDVVSTQDSTMLLFPIPFLFFWKSAQVSGNAVR